MKNDEQPAAYPNGQLVKRIPFSLWGLIHGNPSLLMLVSEIRSTLKDCQTVLDVGCGNFSPLRFLPQSHVVGMDGYTPAIEEACRSGTHNEYFRGNVLQIGKLFPDRRFDACVALDVIEHLPKEDGWQMLTDMERLATKRVIIFTPNGFIPQNSQNGDLQEHLSGWTAGEMRQRGYRIFGMYGPKSLRGEYHKIKHQPRAFWLLVSFLGHYFYTHSHPEKAAAIFCVKELNKR
jgi:SAM-dependent methyltransferase